MNITSEKTAKIITVAKEKSTSLDKKMSMAIIDAGTLAI